MYTVMILSEVSEVTLANYVIIHYHLLSMIYYISARPRGRPKKTWREIVEKDCQACGLNREDAVDRIRWMKQVRYDWRPRYMWVDECFFWYRLTWVVPDKIHRAVKWLCVCFCLSACLWYIMTAQCMTCNEKMTAGQLAVLYRTKSN